MTVPAIPKLQPTSQDWSLASTQPQHAPPPAPIQVYHDDRQVVAPPHGLPHAIAHPIVLSLHHIA
jgi:hypothetical protein